MRIAVFLLAFMAFLAVGCEKKVDIGERLSDALREDGGKELDLKKIVPFAWDELFLFSPYYPTENVCKDLGLDAVSCKKTITQESTDDGVMLMVFRHQGRVVHVELHNRWNGDLTPSLDANPIASNSAVFVVKDRTRLYLKNLAGNDKKSMPEDVARFKNRRDMCDHFRGEPTEGDAEHARFVVEQANAYCAGTDRKLAELKKKYEGDVAVLQVLKSYEICIEAQSKC